MCLGKQRQVEGALGAPDQLELETKCGRGSHVRPKVPSGPPSELWSIEVAIRCGRESPAKRALGAPDWVGSQKSWGPEKLLIRCSKESHQPAESWAPGPPVEQPLRTRKTHTLTAIRVEVIILQFCSDSNSLSHTNVTIKWEVYILLKKPVLVSLLCCVVMIMRI